MISKSKDGHFEYEPYPANVIRRKENIDSFKILVRLLNEGNAGRPALAELPETDSDKLRLEYRMQILAYLACCSKEPKVDLKAMKKRVLNNEDGDVVAFNHAVADVLNGIGIL